MLLPPTGLLAALRSYQSGFVDFRTAGLLAPGFFFRTSLAALVATRIHGDVLRRIFAAFLLIVSLHMIFGRHGR